MYALLIAALLTATAAWADLRVAAPQDDRSPLPRLLPRPGQNTISLADDRHLVIRNLELDGRNLPVKAVTAENDSHYADFIILDRLYIHDHVADQENVGISTKSPAFGWIVRGNRLERVGTGMYFGHSDGSGIDHVR